MKKYKKPSVDGIPLQKKHGQYFLRDHGVTDAMLKAVALEKASVFEIGCGDGFLTKEILQKPVARLSVFEIDPSWAEKVSQSCKDERLHMEVIDFTQVTKAMLVDHAPWIVLSNLPYHMTFPILYHIFFLKEYVSGGVFMMQEEVAQKIVKTKGKGYGYISLFFQYYFEWKLLTKVPPTAFYPQPKVDSRLIAFSKKVSVEPIPQEEQFWKFIKSCFAFPRRTLRNNIMQTHIDIKKIPEKFLDLRSQQMNCTDFLTIWSNLIFPAA